MTVLKNRKIDGDISGRALCRRLGIPQVRLVGDTQAGRLPRPTGSSPGGGWRWFTPAEAQVVRAYYAARPLGRIEQRRAAGLYTGEDVAAAVGVPMSSWQYALRLGRIPPPTRTVPGWVSGPYYNEGEFQAVVETFRKRDGWIRKPKN